VLVEEPAPLRPSPRAAAPLLLFETPLEAETFLGAINRKQKAQGNRARIEKEDDGFGRDSRVLDAVVIEEESPLFYREGQKCPFDYPKTDAGLT
jgi:hypothetical protein